MQSFNHVAGGFAFTGIFCSFAEVNIFDSFPVMGAVWIAAVLPDIDHTKSLTGKAVYPLAKWLQEKYGHRTVTHSLWFLLAVVIVVKGFDNLFHQHFTLPVALALSSHLIFDMCTKQGIPIFYPFSRRPAVLPANPKLRLSANDFRSEAIVFVLFCCLNVFSYPLMASGFWSKYNKTLATWDHFEGERKRKHGDYLTRYLNAQADSVRGLFVAENGSEIVFFADGQFVREKRDLCRLVDFQKVTGKHQFTSINLLQVTADSLNNYMSLPVVKVTAQSTQELFYFEGPIMKKGTELTIDYPNKARFQQLATDNSQTEYQLKILTANYNEQKRKFAVEIAKLSAIREELKEARNRQTTNDFDEGQRRERVKELTAQVAQIVTPDPPNVELYQVERAMLEMKLNESASLNATILVWEAGKNQN